MLQEQSRMELFGLGSSDLIHRGARSVVYRATRPGHESVVIKTRHDDRQRVEQRLSLEREWELLRRVRGVEGIVQALRLERAGGQLGLILADQGASSLEKLGWAGTLTLPRFVDLALHVARALDSLHGHGIIHRDIRPSNIVVSAASGSLELIDLGSATLLNRESTPPSGLNRLEGTLTYMSPEQTGRMNRSVDFRTDYYSLGVTLFELATGVLPFNADDPLQLVHAHIARQPPSPAEFNPSIPQAVCEIILKLLAKDAEHRYQSLRSLCTDLQQCRARLEAGNAEFSFELSAERPSDGFELSHRLYGRDAELTSLREAFDRTLHGEACVVTLGGGAGVGKSSLAQKLVPWLYERRGAFAAGKFEQYEGGSPYAALGQVLESLSEQLFGGEGDGSAREAELRAALETSAGALVDLAPSLARFATRQTSPASSEEAPRRLKQALEQFLNLAVTAERPLCLFLDDVQWADADSLELVGGVFGGLRERPLTVVLAYRDDEVSEPHPLLRMLEHLKGERIRSEHLALAALGVADCVALVADAMRLSAPDAERLGAIVHRRTSGNPLFVRAFLLSLRAAELLPLDPSNLARSFTAIEHHTAPEGVVDLLVERVGRLPSETQEVLKTAACLGNLFEPATLSVVSAGDVADSLWPALQAELVFTLGSVSSPADLRSAGARCRFAHDRIQQAVLSMLSPAQLGPLHLQIGWRLVRGFNADPASRHVFEAARHLNRALPWIGEHDELVQLAELNLRAARAALACAAATEALDFARAGLSALGDAAWHEHYELTRDLNLAIGDGAYALGDDDALHATIATILTHAQKPLDIATTRRLEGQVYHTRFRIGDAFRAYREALAQLGVQISATPSAREVGDELRLTFEAVRHRSFDDLLALAPCEDRGMAIAIEVLSRFVLLAYATTSELFPLLVCRQVRLSMEFGNSAESAIGYTFYGLLLSRNQDLDRACRFGQLALDLAHKFDDRTALSQTYLYANYQLMHWKVPLGELVEPFQRAHEYALQVGAPFNTACSATTLCITRFWSGDELSGLMVDLERYRVTIARLRQGMVLNWHEVLLQMVQNLSCDRADPTLFEGPFYDERQRLPVHQAAGDHSAQFNYHLAKAFVCYLFDDYETALVSTDANQPFVSLYGTSLWAVPVVWVDALIRIAASHEAEPERREVLLGQARGDLEKLRTWQAYNHNSLRPKVRAVEAALAQAKGDLRAAGPAFAEAVELAQREAVAHDEAIINELAGKFAIATHDGGLSRTYLRTAHRAYLRWGATRKASALERRNPMQLPNSALGVGAMLSLASTHTFDLLDLVSVLNASRALSSEIKLDKLLQRLMALLVESGGAETGYLLLQKDGMWEPEVGHTSPNRGTASGSNGGQAQGALGPLARSIVERVIHSGETLVVGDAHATGDFQRDPDVAARRVRSVLCFPLRRQGALFAIVYLENNAARAVFTANNVRILEMLSTQAVTSLENADLYERLEQKVASRTRELEEKNVEIARALQRLTVMQERLITQEKLAALGALTAGIAHEIKNPLHFVENFAEVAVRLGYDLGSCLAPQLAQESPGRRDEAQELLDDLQTTTRKIREHGARATAIVNGMAMHAGKSGGEREMTDVNSLLSQSVMLAAHSARRQRREIQIETEYDMAIGNVHAVAQDLSRVFVNLINNALYSVEQKSIRLGAAYLPAIEVRTIALGDDLEVRVRDNGDGIPPSLLSKVFTPFFTTKPSGQGSGLGLSISHDVVVRGHGGDLRVESVEGEYAEFVVSLPRTPDHAY